DDHRELLARLFQPRSARQALLDDAAKAPIGDQVVSTAEEGAQQGERAEREDIAARGRAPGGLETPRALDRLWVGRGEARVERARGRADEHVGLDAALIQRFEHAGL